MKVAVDFTIRHGFICQFMEDNKLTTKELAEKIGISITTLSAIIRLKYPVTKGHGNCNVMTRMVKFFNMPLDTLFPEEYLEIVKKNIETKHRLYKDIDILSIEYMDKRQLTYEPENNVDKDIIHNRIANAIETLTEKEAYVLKRVYGFDYPQQSVAEIAETLGISRCRVHQIQNKALSKLQHPNRRDMLLIPEEVKEDEEEKHEIRRRKRKCHFTSLREKDSPEISCSFCKNFVESVHRANYSKLNEFPVYNPSLYTCKFKE